MHRFFFVFASLFVAIASTAFGQSIDEEEYWRQVRESPYSVPSPLRQPQRLPPDVGPLPSPTTEPSEPDAATLPSEWLRTKRQLQSIGAAVPPAVFTDEIRFAKPSPNSPQPIRSAPQTSHASVGDRSKKIAHLTQAIEHLEAAGLKDEAKKVRDILAKERESALDDIAAMQAEISRLRALLSHDPIILLHLCAINISRTSLAKAGYKIPDNAFSAAETIFASRPNTNDHTQQFRQTSPWNGIIPTDSSQAALKKLQKKTNVNIIANPTLVAVNGRHVCLSVGGEIPIPSSPSKGIASIEWKRYGTEVNVVASVTNNRTIKLDCKVSESSIDDRYPIKIGDLKVPGLIGVDMKTQTEIPIGHTLVLGMPILKESPDYSFAAHLPWLKDYLPKEWFVPERHEMLFIITPELVDAPASEKK